MSVDEDLIELYDVDALVDILANRGRSGHVDVVLVGEVIMPLEYHPIARAVPVIVVSAESLITGDFDLDVEVLTVGGAFTPLLDNIASAAGFCLRLVRD